MKQGWFKYTYKDRPCFIEFIIYGSRRAMRVGMARHRKNNGFNVSQHQCEIEEGAHAFCRMWTDKIGCRNITTSRIFLNTDDYSAGVLAHECFHAAKRIITDLCYGHFREELCATLIEKAVNDFTEWKDLGFPDEIKEKNGG